MRYVLLFLEALLIFYLGCYKVSDANRSGKDKQSQDQMLASSVSEQDKLRRAEEAANQFIERWHDALDLNVLFDEMYVTNAEQRYRNVAAFYCVYKFVAFTTGPKVAEDVNDEAMRTGFMAFWNWYYLKMEYLLAFQHSEDNELVIPRKIDRAEEKLGTMGLSETEMTLAEIKRFVAAINDVSSQYRKYLSHEKLNSPMYKKNLKNHDVADNRQGYFRLRHGFSEYGIKEDIEVYELTRGVFDFYFIEEGKLKVLTLGFEL